MAGLLVLCSLSLLATGLHSPWYLYLKTPALHTSQRGSEDGTEDRLNGAVQKATQLSQGTGQCRVMLGEKQ